MSSFHSTEDHPHIYIQRSPQLQHQGYWQPHEMDPNQLYHNQFLQNKPQYTVQSYLDQQQDPWSPERVQLDDHRLPRTTVAFTTGYGHTIDTQWPGPDDFQRQVSPDSTTLSTASGWSVGQTEHLPLHIGHGPYAYDSPPATPDHCQLPYRDTPTYSHMSPTFGPGGGICMSDVQAVADQQDVSPEESYDNQELRTEFKHEYYPEHEDSGVGDSLPDAESVHYGTEPDSCCEEDDYTPKKRRATPRKLRGSQTSNSTSPSQIRRSNGRTNGHANGVTAVDAGRKRKRRASNGTKNNSEERAFPCPLKKYGCHATFSTKNEWKRHVATQHIKLGYWRCDLCPPQYDAAGTTEYHNDFNRKDLFSQHLRRMHSAKAKNGGLQKNTKPLVTEDNLVDHQSRCYHVLRAQPSRSQCLFCTNSFRGRGSWDDRMEHVGKHLEADEALGRDTELWRVDAALERYFLDEGLIVYESGEWRLGDGTPLRGEQGEELEEDVDEDDGRGDENDDDDGHADSDADADGEDE